MYVLYISSDWIEYNENMAGIIRHTAFLNRRILHLKGILHKTQNQTNNQPINKLSHDEFNNGSLDFMSAQLFVCVICLFPKLN